MEVVFAMVFFFIAVRGNTPETVYELVVEYTNDRKKRVQLYIDVFKTRFYYVIPAIGIFLGHYGRLAAVGYLMGFIASGSISKIEEYLRKLETE